MKSATAVIAVVAAAAGFVGLGIAGPRLAGGTSSPPSSSPSPSVPRSAPPAAVPPSPSVRRLPGAVPSVGSGTFGYGRTQGRVLGRAGTLHRYLVAVEHGAGEDIEAFAAVVDAALGDPRGWTRGGGLRLQRVPRGAAHEFTVHLATAETAGRMCAAGGINIRVNGRPYTSCRIGDKVIINLARWRLSIPDYMAARVPLDAYRQYVVNHEVGHELGHRHELCPGRGRPAPVMMQQTLGLRGCTANAWPYLNGRWYAGPPK